MAENRQSGRSWEEAPGSSTRGMDTAIRVLSMPALSTFVSSSRLASSHRSVLSDFSIPSRLRTVSWMQTIPLLSTNLRMQRSSCCPFALMSHTVISTTLHTKKIPKSPKLINLSVFNTHRADLLQSLRHALAIAVFNLSRASPFFLSLASHTAPVGKRTLHSYQTCKSEER